MEIKLSDHFTYKKLLQFTLPSVLMMLFTSIYGVIDGLFVSNYVGKTAFASLNLVMPFLQILSGFGAMLGVGGSALVAKTLGEGKRELADRYFTMMIKLMVMAGLFFTLIGILFIRPVSYLLGASEAMIEDCVLYGRTILLFNVMMLMQYTFQSFLVVAEKPNLGLAVTVAAGCTNMVLDAFFMAVLDWGILGAALATGLSQTIGGGIPLLWFAGKRNQSALHFVKTRIVLAPMAKACGNGASEMLSSVSGSITGLLYNLQLMKHAGEDGVAAYGVVMYAAFIFIAILMGYVSGGSPIMGYHYGAGNTGEMKNLFRKNMMVLGLAGFTLTASAILLAEPISRVFVGYDAQLMQTTVRAFRICAMPFLLMGFDIYSSSLFTALNDGMISAIISFLRSLIFPLITVILLPYFFRLDGVWYSLVVSEVFAFFAGIFFVFKYKKKYQY